MFKGIPSDPSCTMMKDPGLLCPLLAGNDRVSYILARPGIFVCNEGVRKDPRAGEDVGPSGVRGAPTTRVTLSSARRELLSIIIIFSSHSALAKLMP